MHAALPSLWRRRDVQAIGLAVVASPSAWPAFEIWSSAGGGTYTRAVYTWMTAERQYCATRVDEFEEHGDEAGVNGAIRIAGETRFVRYARSGDFGCESAA